MTLGRALEGEKGQLWNGLRDSVPGGGTAGTKALGQDAPGTFVAQKEGQCVQEKDREGWTGSRSNPRSAHLEASFQGRKLPLWAGRARFVVGRDVGGIPMSPLAAQGWASGWGISQ